MRTTQTPKIPSNVFTYGVRSFDSSSSCSISTNSILNSDDEITFQRCGSDEDSSTVDDDFVIMVNNTENRKKKQQRNKSPPDEPNNDASNAKAVAAAFTTGAVGLVFGGPIAAALVGLGTMYVAKIDKVTPVGDAARSVGSILTDAIKDVDRNHLHITSNVKTMDEKLHVSDVSSVILEKTKETFDNVNQQTQLGAKVHSVVRNVNTFAYSTQNRVRFYNEKHGFTDKLKTLWNNFEKNVLLTDDDREFQKQIQYLIMERELEEEEQHYEQMVRDRKYNNNNTVTAETLLQ